MSELPMGWESVTVGGVCSVAPSDPPLAPDAPFIPMASVEVGLRYPVSTELRGDRGGIRARAGDLLFARITPCLENEKVAVVPPDLAVVGGSTEFIVVRPPTGVASSILYYWSLHPLVRSHARERMAGTTGRMRLSSSDLAEAPFWLPPTREQERIVTAIEEAFSKLDAGEAGLRAVRQLLKRMREAVLAAAVTGCLVPQDATETPATELLADLGISLAQEMHEVPATWAWAALGSLLREPLRNGMSAVKADASDGLPTFSITAVTTGDFSSANIKHTAGDWSRAADLWAETGDLFVQRSNTPELVGTARLYRGVPRAAIFPDLLIRIRPVRQVRAEWLELVLSSPACRTFIRSQAQGLAGSMPKISQPVLERLAVPVPPEEEQDRIVTEVERQFSFIEACERAVETGLNRSEALRRAVLKAAFDGRLVPQDPTDEPASALLERIRGDAERRPPSRRRPRPARSSGDPAGIESRASRG